MTELTLGYGLGFAELYERDGLVRLDRAFVAHLAAGDAALRDRLVAARADVSKSPGTLDKKGESELLVDLAPHVEDFLGGLFGIEKEIGELQARHNELAPLYSVKRLFVQRRAVKEVKEDEAVALDGDALRATLGLGAPRSSLGSGATLRPSRVGSKTKPRMPLSCARRSNTPPGRRCHPRVSKSTGAGCCSRSRTGST
jgi:hypothetical protein